MTQRLDPTLFGYIWRHSRRAQLGLLGLALAALPIYFASLNLPKAIVNGPISGIVETRFLEITVPIPGAGQIVLFEGFALERVAMLFALSFLFLGLVLINGLFKYFINTYKGQLGERVLRRLRFELVDRVLRFPPSQFRKVKPSEIATMVKDEVEPLGGFIGDAIVHPIYQGGLALTALAFIMLQSFWLGLMALAIVLIQAFLIPRLRQPILALGRARQLAARDLAGHVAEIVDGIHEIRAHDVSNYERVDITRRLGHIFEIRYEIFRRKFFIKFLNNFLSHVTPFLFYAVGGYFAIKGQMDIGQLVAVIAAYKDLPAPIKELINWDHQRLDVQIKYEQVADHFDPDGLIEPDLQRLPYEAVPALSGSLTAQNLGLIDDSGARLLESVTFSVPVSKRVCVVGPPGGGKDHLGQVLSRAMPLTSGAVTVGGDDLTRLPDYVAGRRMASISQDVFLFPASVRDNITYGLRHAPWAEDMPHSEEERAVWAAERAEAIASGNADLPLHADWIDYAGAGAEGPDDLDERLIDVLRTVDMLDDLYDFGLRWKIDPATDQELAGHLLAARMAIADRLKADHHRDLIELFDENTYNHNATVAENILFGSPCSTRLAPEKLAANEYMIWVLEQADLRKTILLMGYEIACAMVDMFADLPADHPFFEQYGFISAADLPLYQEIVSKSDRYGLVGLSDDEQMRLKALPYSYVEARHRLNLIDAQTEKRILRARDIFIRHLPDYLEDQVEFFKPGIYNIHATILDNLLLGRVAYGRAGAAEAIAVLIRDVLEERDLIRAIHHVGLGYHVGTGGKRLTVSQRQKLGLARAIVKRPDLLIVNLALAVLDRDAQERILDNILSWPETRGVVWILARPELADRFEHILVMEGGHVVDEGAFRDLSTSSDALRRLLPARPLTEQSHESAR